MTATQKCTDETSSAAPNAHRSRVVIAVALLPDLLLGRLRTALGSDSTVFAVDSVDEPDGLTASLQHGDVDLIVLDPSDRRLEQRTHTLAAALARYLSIPVVLYTALTTSGVSRAAALLHEGSRHLLIAGVEDQPGATRALAVRLTMDALAQRFLASLDSQLAQLPPAVVRGIHALFASPRRFQSVEDIALASAVTRRHLERVTRRVGFASCRDLLIIARTLAAFRLLRHEHRPLGQVAARLGAEPRVLGRQVRVLLGASSTFDLATLSEDQLIETCTSALCRRDAPAHRASPRTHRAPSAHSYDER